MENQEAVWQQYIVYALLMLLMFIAGTTFGQVTATHFNAGWNSDNSVEWFMSLKDCKTKNTVDIRGIGFYSLGSHRKSLDSDQKKEYLKIFEQYFLKSFSSRLAEYSDPKIRVDSQEKLNEKYTMVSSTLLAGEDKPEVKIDWRIVTKDLNNPLIIDVVIEGVSLAKVQKEEFNSIIQSNGGDIKALFTTLQEFINQ